MKLIRFGEPGKEKPGVLIGEKRYDVSAIVVDYNEAFFENNELEKLKRAIAGDGLFPKVDASVRLGSPVTRPSKIICIGLNYVDHCIETNATIPVEPIIFFKSTTALCGPDDDLIIPKNKHLKPVGEYNTAKLIVRGNHVEHWLNGTKVVTYEMGSHEMNTLLKESKFKDNPGYGKSPNGLIMFQHHGQKVWFKNIRVRRL